MATSRHKNLKKLGAVTATAAILGTWVVVAMNNDGIANAQIELNDGGVWVTNNEKQLVGHLNYPAMTLDSTVRTSAADFDIDQTGDSVLFHNQSDSVVSTIDPAFVTFGADGFVEGATSVEMGGTTVAAYDPSEGTLWSAPFDMASTVKAEANVQATDVTGGVISVSTDGTVQLASIEDSVWQVGEESLDFPAGIEADSRIQVSSVGDEPVLLDQDGKILYFADGSSTSIAGDQLQLQQAGPKSDVVLVASATELLEIPFGGSDITAVPASGDHEALVPGNAAQPAMHNGCAYGAWSGTGTFVRDCEGTDNDISMAHPDLTQAQTAVFRTNRDVIVLNDAADGKVWLPDENLQLVENWEQITTEDENADKENEERSNTLSDEPVDPEMQEENRSPVAENDTFGARPGSVTVLPVLLNDSDEDGDILTVAAQGAPNMGDLVRIRGGSAFQITLPEDASGSTTFTYRAADGRGGEDDATVTVNVHDRSINSAPEQVVNTKVKLAQKGRVTVEALGDWLDPDGDPVYLQNVQQIEGLEIRFRQNGSIEITDVGSSPGLKQIPITVSDGQVAGEGVLLVELSDVSAKPPVANADHVTVSVGETAQVSPLTNDTDPNGDSLRLVSIGTPPDGIIARASTTLGTVSISANKVGTYYLTYSVSDGTASSTGKIRIDAVEAAEETDPVAEADIAMLPAGGSVLVDVLANDWDPAGGVLTISGVDTVEGSALRVAPLQYEMIRVTAPQGLTKPESFTYTISNGIGTATGTVLVVPTEANTGNEPPEVNADSLVVRAGDVGTVAVLDNDYSPSGQELTVSPELDYSFDDAAGEPFVSDNLVRFRATDQTGEFKVVYTVTDPLGNVGSGTVTITVVPVDAENNTAPTPRDVTVRTMAGKPVRIPIPLMGIDAEGDSVDVMGTTSAPSLGVVEVNADGSFTYTPHETSSGTDSFTYQVRDSFGATAEARVRIGIAPPPTINQNPVAQNDLITVRPGARVEAPVISNDVDPDGDPISLAHGATTTSEPTLGIEEVDDLLVITAPTKEGSYSVSYRVEDDRGGSARGLLTVTVQEDSPLLAPIAVDDFVEITGSPASVTVNVLDNDRDPDGAVADLVVTSNDAGVSVGADRQLTIQTTNKRQQILYTIADLDGGKASAIVWVPAVLAPGEEDPEVPPALIPGSLITANAGEPTAIDLADYITPAVTITDPAKVTAALGWNGAALPKSATTLEYTSEPDFAGRTSITLEVKTEAGVTGTITLPVEVIGSENRPPSFVGNVVELGAGEDPIVLNLAAMSEDPDGDPLTFTLVSAPQGISATMNGDQLTVSAPVDAALGGAGNIQVEVSDGTETVAGTIPVTIVATNAPLIQIGPINQTATAGETVTIDVAAAATNPFPDPVTLAGPPGVISGAANVAASGTSVSITPQQTGEVVVGFTLRDATGQVGRDVSSTITLTVRDVPDAPVLTSVDKQGDASVIVSWNAGPTNGAAFTGFTLRDLAQGDSKNCGVATQCVMTGRQMGVEHTFQVIATNEVGQSEPSNTLSILMDVVPERMAAPSVSTNSGGIVDVTWSAPVSRGTPVQSVTVCLNGGVQCSGPLPASQRSYQFTVAAGSEHFATTTATNQEGTSDPSPQSASVMAWSAPGAISNLRVSQAGLGNASVVTFAWDPPAPANGAGPFTYQGSMNGVAFGPISGTSVTMPASSVAGSGSYSVVASGKADSPRAQTTASVLADVPAAPAGGTVKSTGQSGTLQVTPPAKPSGGGWTSNQLSWQYQIPNVRDWTALGDGVITGLADGSTATVNLRLVGSANGTSLAGVSAPAGSAQVSGPFILPALNCQATGWNSATCTLSGGSEGGLPAWYEVTLGAHADIVNSGATLTYTDLEPSTDYQAILTGARTSDPTTQDSVGVNVRTHDKPITEADYPNPLYSFSLSNKKAPCYVGCNNSGYMAPIVNVTFSGYMPNEPVRCSTMDGTYWGDFVADASGGGTQALWLNGYGQDGGGGEAVSSDAAAAYSIWKCSRGTPNP